MRTQFFIIIWLNIKKKFNVLIKTIKVFASNANTLTVLKSPFITNWKEKNNIFTASYAGMTMHIVFSSKINLWIWQIGNYEYFERGQSESFEEAKSHVESVCLFYLSWESKNDKELYFSDVIWHSDNNNGYTGSWGDYDFWLSPLTTEEHNNLWRYDIYKSNETKSIQSGVTRNINIARKSCIKIVQMLAYIQTEK